MSNQERHDAGKPALHYWYSNLNTAGLALLDEDEASGDFDANGVIQLVISFLGGHPRDVLVEAVIGLLELADRELPPSRPHLLGRATRRGVQAYCDVCLYGEGKYERGNYRLGQSYCHYLDSALGHLQHMVINSEGAMSKDFESGQFDLGHALWNIVQVLEQPHWRDDRLPAIVMTRPATEEK